MPPFRVAAQTLSAQKLVIGHVLGTKCRRPSSYNHVSPSGDAVRDGGPNWT